MLIEFIIPCYNEEQILKQNTLKLLNFLKLQKYSFNWKIILLLNGTTDNSKLLALELEKQNHEINLFIIPEKGKGNALKKYFDHSSGNFLIYMDIDLAVSLENINDLLTPFLKENYDIVIGSRLLKKSRTNRSFFRELTSRFYILLSKIIIKHPFSDLQCGFKGIKKETWLKVSSLIKDKYWFFDTELLFYINYLNYKYKEISVNWSENRYGKRKSKIKLLKDSLLFIKNLINLRKNYLKKN
jgi:glycosyltransferase involved in cell wall biosynthesis